MVGSQGRLVQGLKERRHHVGDSGAGAGAGHQSQNLGTDLEGKDTEFLHWRWPAPVETVTESKCLGACVSGGLGQLTNLGQACSRVDTV